MNQPRVLLVDDEEMVRSVVRRLLEPAGFTVSVVDSAASAKPALQSEQFEAVILDIRMPDVDGCELYRWMQAEVPGLTDKVAFLTGEPITGTLARFIEETGRPVISKPFGRDELIESLRAIARAT